MTSAYEKNINISKVYVNFPEKVIEDQISGMTGSVLRNMGFKRTQANYDLVVDKMRLQQVLLNL